MASEELKPCPFCGGVAEVSFGYKGDNLIRLPFVECIDCAASTDMSDHTYEVPQAISRWNRRA